MWLIVCTLFATLCEHHFPYKFHFPKILCQPLFLNYAKHICRVLSPTGLIFVCTVIMTVPFISTYFFLRFGWTSTKSIIMTGTYLLFQSDVSLYGAFLMVLDNNKNNCSSRHSKYWLTSIIQMSCNAIKSI